MSARVLRALTLAALVCAALPPAHGMLSLFGGWPSAVPQPEALLKKQQQQQPDAVAQAPAPPGGDGEKFECYWHNPTTGETTWREPVHEHVDPATGVAYFVDPENGDVTWERPAALAWRAQETADGVYYYNEVTAETTWTPPAMHAWQKVPVAAAS